MLTPTPPSAAAIARAAIRAPVLEIQRFSIHDGPGIRSLVFLKGCNLRCVWCQNPEAQEAAPAIGFYRNRCRQSFECRAVCAAGAIARGDFRIDYERCTRCHRCVAACAYEALRPLGEYLTPEQLLERLEADVPYYGSSGGGVTFTGGEPTLHTRFMERVLTLCRARGIHTNLETAGTFSFPKWRPLLDRLDLIYFDLKIMDLHRHRRFIGGSHARILRNARQLVASGYPVEFRLALVAGYTDTPANLGAIAALLHALERPRLHLLRYHNMGEAKLDLVDARQPRLGLAPYPDEAYARAQALLQLNRIEIVSRQ